MAVGSVAATSSTNAVAITSVYVHPLSQMVLQCLQTNCHEWVQSKNLHANLIIRGDGTFVTESTTAITTSLVLPNRRSKPITDVDNSVAMMNHHYARNSIKIWTTYEKEERKHWLCVSVANNDNPATDPRKNGTFEPEILMQNRYMLQDNTLTPWQSHSKVRGSIPERVQTHVDEMIHDINAICG